MKLITGDINTYFYKTIYIIIYDEIYFSNNHDSLINVKIYYAIRAELTRKIINNIMTRQLIIELS